MTEKVQGHITYSSTLNSLEVLLGITGEEREGTFIRVECNGPDIFDDDIHTLLSVPFIVAVDAIDLLDISLASMGIPEPPRSEERRVGKECVSRCRSGWWPYH